ncbi:MAG: Methyltransferase, partial [Candidatus Giovannonibacteria bacterium GW2011_GWA2_53_7]
MIAKTQEEIEILREGGRRLARHVRILSEMVKPGLVARDLEYKAREMVKADGDELAFHGHKERKTDVPYPSGLCLSINDIIVHSPASENSAVIREGDVRDIRKLFPAHSFDVVVSNPPYRKAASGRINPVPEKALARHELMGTVKDFLQAAGYVLRLAGRAFFIYPATRMAELVCSMRGARIEP